MTKLRDIGELPREMKTSLESDEGFPPVKVRSKVKPSTFHILTVWSDDAVARYLKIVP